jgi:threonine/homoserine/homoserine lactone efflux protein
MLDLSILITFIPAAIALIVSPGPDSIYTLTRAISDGRTAGVTAALGSSSGSIVHTIGAVLGLSAIFRTSALAFTAVKFVGAGYLVYLGIQTVRNREEFEITPETPETPEYTPVESYRHALMINVLNPRVAIFFLAFLPQFVQSGGNVPLQIFAFGVAFATLGFLYQAALAVFSSKTRRVIAERKLVRSALRYASGSVLVGFGIRLALEERVSG